jgi:hypothetical protein
MTPSAGCFAPATKKGRQINKILAAPQPWSKDLTVPAPSGMTYSTTHGSSVCAATALMTNSQGTPSKNRWMSRSITQSVFQQRCRHAATASRADLPGR